jgi:hypothetical protein
MYKTKKRYQGEPIRTDPSCDPKENETAIHFSAGDRTAWISSYEESVVAGLLAHPDFKIEELVLMRLERQDSVVGVVGRIPLAALRIGRSRGTSLHELIVPPILKERLSTASAAQAPSRNGEPGRSAKAQAAKSTLGTKISKKSAHERKAGRRSKTPRALVPTHQLPLALGSGRGAKTTKGQRPAPTNARRASAHARSRTRHRSAASARKSRSDTASKRRPRRRAAAANQKTRSKKAQRPHR